MTEIGEAPDRIYCVVDRDTHHHFEESRKRLNEKNGPYYFIYAEPCYEYWLLLHFQYHSSPFEKRGKKSICDSAQAELKKHLEGYHKSDVGIFNKLSEKVQYAMENSRKRLMESEEDSCSNPSSNFHELVGYLINLKK